MTYDEMMSHLAEIETAIQTAQDAGESADALISEAMALESQIEATPEFEDMIERLGE